MKKKGDDDGGRGGAVGVVSRPSPRGDVANCSCSFA